MTDATLDRMEQIDRDVAVSPPGYFSGLLEFWTDSNWITRAAILTALFLITLALLTPLIAPHDPNAQRRRSIRC